MEAMEAAVNAADVVVPWRSVRACRTLAFKFAQRFKKNHATASSGAFNVPDVPAAIAARNVGPRACYSEYRWEDFVLRMVALRAKVSPARSTSA